MKRSALSRRAFSKLAMAVLLGPAAVRADTFNWTSTGNALWSNAANWSLATSPATHLEPTLSHDAVLPFASPVTTINLLAGEQAKSLSVFDTYRLNGGDLTLAGAIFVEFPERLTLDSELTGGNGLTKNGAGSLYLGNASNSYTGNTLINAGTVIIESQAALGASSSTIVVSAPNGTVGNAGGQLVLNGLGGDINLTRGLQITGGGPAVVGYALVSFGDNQVNNLTITGGITTRVASSQGMLTISNPISLPNITASFGGTFHTTLSGTITGGASAILDKGGSGTLILTGNNTSSLTGIVQISGGNLRVNGAAPLGSGTQVNAVNLNGGTLEVRANSVSGFETRKVRFSTNTGLFVDHDITDGPLAATQLKQNFTFADFANNANNVTFTASGRSGSSLTFTGAATVLQTGNNITFNNNTNGVVTYAGFVANDTTARTFTFGGNSETVITTNLTAGAGAGAHNLTKSGSGTLSINGTGSNYTGATNVTGGTLVVRSFDAINASSTSGQLLLGNATTTSAAVSYLGAAGTGAGETVTKPINFNTTTASVLIHANQAGTAPTPLVINSALTAVAGNKTFVLGGSSAASILNEVRSVIPAAGGTLNVQKIGGNTWMLTGANAYTGATNVSGGVLRVTDTGASTSVDVVPNAGAVAFTVDTFTNAAGGTFQYMGAADRASTELVGALTPTAGHGTISVSPGATVSGTPSATLTFGSLGTRTAGATLNFTPAAGGSVVFSAAAGANGILGGYATFNGVDWAAQVPAGGTLTAYSGYTAGLPATGASSTTNYLVDATSSTTAAQSVNSLKFAPTAAGQTITLGGALTITSGGVLFDNSNGPATITGSQLGAAAELIVTTNGTTAGNALTIGSLVGTGSAALTKSGTGTLILTAANAYTGNTVVNQGTVQLTGANAALGNPGSGNSLTIRQGATLDLNAAGSGAKINVGLLAGAGTITNSGGGSNAEVTLNLSNAANTTTGTAYFTGLLQDGTGGGKLNVIKGGASGFLQYLHGVNTYSGSTTINSGTLAVTTLADIGQPSGIGRGDGATDTTNAASLVFGGGTLQYIGANATVYQETQTPSVSTNRLFTLAGSGTIDSSGQYGNSILSGGARNDAALVFRNTGQMRFSGAAGPRALTLTGNSLGDNEIALELRDMDASNALSLTKAGTGMWRLTNASNAYTGNTTISGGVLQVGNLQSNASLPGSSPLILGGGVLQTSGSFTRALAGAAPSGNANTVFWTTGGGFAASNAKLTVSIGGGSTSLNWEATGFVANSQALILNSATALAEVELTNPINLSGTTNAWPRTIQADDNSSTQTDYATLSGVISGGPAAPGTIAIQKTNTGVLQLLGANTYSGDTLIAAGTLVVKSVGGSGPSSSLGDASGVLRIGNSGTTSNLWYIGPGETSSRSIQLNQTSGTTVIDASGTGPLVLSNVTNGGAGAKTFSLRGTNSDANEISSVLADNGGALSLSKSEPGTWILSGANTYTGTSTINSGIFGFGSSSSNDWSATTGSGPIGRGGLTVSNVNFFAAGGDRSVANPVSFSNNSTLGFLGTHSLSIQGAVTVANGNNTNNFVNNITAGNVLTFGAIGTADTSSASKLFNFLGAGDTVVTGPITTGSGSTLGVTYSGTGSLTLSATSGSNYNGVTTISSGTLRVTSVAALGSTSRVQLNAATFDIRMDSGANFNKPIALGGNGTISLDASIGGTAVGGVHAFTAFTHPNTTAQTLTINGNNNLYGISFTSVALNTTTGNNTTFAPNNAFVNINGPVTNPMSGTLTSSNFDTLTLDGTSTGNTITGAISDMPGGSLATGGTTRLTKNNTSTWTLSGTSTYTGATTINGGRLALASGGNLGNTAVTVNAAGTLAVIPGTNGAANTIGGTLALPAGATLTMQDGATSTLSVGGTATLGTASGAATNLLMDVAGGVSNAADLLAITGAATNAGPVRLSVGGVGTGALSSGQQLTLITAPSGLTPANFSLATSTVMVNGVSYTVDLSNSTSSAIILTVTSGGTNGSAYWTGDQDGNWSTNNAGNTNWATGAATAVDLGATPGALQDVYFSATTPAPANLTTTVGTDTTINSLNFTAASPAVTVGAAGSETLTLLPNTAGAVGLTVAAGAAAHTITVPVAVGNSQTWNVDSTNVFTVGNINLGGNVLTVGGAGKTTLNGTITGAAGNGLVKTGSGTLTLAGTNSYSGPTSLNQGTLTVTGSQVLTGALQFGSAPATTTVGTLDLSTSSLRVASLLAQTNSTSATTVNIGNGQSLRVNGITTIGYNSSANTQTRVTLSGAGTFTVGIAGTPTNANFTLGGNTTTNFSNAVTFDMSGLSTFFANLGSGTFRVGDATNSGGTSASGSTLTLANTNTIFATTFTSDSPDSAVTQTINLGATSTAINANTINIGGSASGRSNGVLQFAEITGTLTVRNLAGTGRANMNVSYGGTATGAAPISSVDFSGHDANLMLTALNIGGRTATSGGSSTGSMTFDTGTLDTTGITLGDRRTTATDSSAATVTGTSTATLTLNGGTTTVGTNGIVIAPNSSTTSATTNTPITTVTNAVVGRLNIDGNAQVTVAATTGGSSIILGQNTAATAAQTTITSDATLAITGGTLSVAGDIGKGAGAGVITSKLTLAGGTLNMNGNDLGAPSPIDTIEFFSGTLSNVKSINGAGGLTKASSGTLTITGTNTYTGPTSVTAGKLLINGTITSNVTANSTSATVGGNGTIAGDLTLSAATLSPGNSPGVLNVTGNVTLSSSATYIAEVGGNTPGNGVANYDQTIATGSLSIAGATLDAQALPGYVPMTSDVLYILVRGDLLPNTTFFANAPTEGAVVNLGNGVTAQITYGANYDTLNPGNSALTGGNDVALYNVVPEPASIGLLGLGATGLLARRRRRR